MTDTRNFLKRKYLGFVELLAPKGMMVVSDDKNHVYLTKTVNPIDKYIYNFEEDFVRYASLEMNAQEIKRKGLSGAIAELGVYKGDFAKELNRLFPDKTLYLFDTFEGFDNKDIEVELEANYSRLHDDFSDTSENMVLSRMVSPENCIIRKGFFPATSEGLENEAFCFVSIDADLYAPIYSGLEFFYPRLVKGGIIFVHDFNNTDYSGACEAVRKFCDREEIGYYCMPDDWGTAVIIR